ncbi:DUF6452 family protein [Winogradskyella sp. R77965]|uniref:DUF6452 family protein n=1 Tax=Winogradskyella sp. R77965 TaxID=3093872 RepID=UPI0037DC8E5C
MNKVNIIRTIVTVILSLVILTTLQNCERDDICAESTPTTPRLLIEFYDATSPDDLKNVPRLTIYGEGLLNEPPQGSSDETIVYNSNTSSAELPLIIDAEEETVTRYILEQDTNLRLDEDTTTDSNIDIIEINYTTKFVYVSRACGYKSIFNELRVVRENDTDNWISNIEIVETIIENENTVHVRIFH